MRRRGRALSRRAGLRGDSASHSAGTLRWSRCRGAGARSAALRSASLLRSSSRGFCAAREFAPLSDRGDAVLRVRRVLSQRSSLRLSGIFATIACGIALRYFERILDQRYASSRMSNGSGSVAALLANVLVFFMVGAALEIGRLAETPLFTVACIVGVAVARDRGCTGCSCPDLIRARGSTYVRVAGMRGALCLGARTCDARIVSVSRRHRGRDVRRFAGNDDRQRFQPGSVVRRVATG